MPVRRTITRADRRGSPRERRAALSDLDYPASQFRPRHEPRMCLQNHRGSTLIAEAISFMHAKKYACQEIQKVEFSTATLAKGRYFNPLTFPYIELRFFTPWL